MKNTWEMLEILLKSIEKYTKTKKLLEYKKMLLHWFMIIRSSGRFVYHFLQKGCLCFECLFLNEYTESMSQSALPLASSLY